MMEPDLKKHCYSAHLHSHFNTACWHIACTSLATVPCVYTTRCDLLSIGRIMLVSFIFSSTANGTCTRVV